MKLLRAEGLSGAPYLGKDDNHARWSEGDKAEPSFVYSVQMNPTT